MPTSDDPRELFLLWIQQNAATAEQRRADLAVLDALPVELRLILQESPIEVVAASVQNCLRRHGLDTTRSALEGVLSDWRKSFAPPCPAQQGGVSFNHHGRSEVTAFSNQGLSELVRTYNTMVDEAHRRGMSKEDIRPVKRFPNQATAVRRCEALSRTLETNQVKTPSDAAANKSPTEAKGPTIKSYTADFNDKVAAAEKEGLRPHLPAWAKHHTSDFGSKEGAAQQVKRLEEAIAKARQLKANPPPPKAAAAPKAAAEKKGADPKAAKAA